MCYTLKITVKRSEEPCVSFHLKSALLIGNTEPYIHNSSPSLCGNDGSSALWSKVQYVQFFL